VVDGAEVDDQQRGCGPESLELDVDPPAELPTSSENAISADALLLQSDGALDATGGAVEQSSKDGLLVSEADLGSEALAPAGQEQESPEASSLDDHEEDVDHSSGDDETKISVAADESLPDVGDDLLVGQSAMRGSEELDQEAPLQFLPVRSTRRSHRSQSHFHNPTATSHP